MNSCRIVKKNLSLYLQMKKTSTFKSFLKRKLTTAALVMASVAAFATLGDGGSKQKTANKSLLIADYTDFRRFTLRPSYFINNHNPLNVKSERFVLMNTVVTFQRGNITYILPMKRKVILDKIKLGTGLNNY
ncbi:MAG: hypothetical protein C4330_05850 [Chitinophagaceae bacterium]